MENYINKVRSFFKFGAESKLDNYGKLFILTIGGLLTFLLFVLYQTLKLTGGGFMRSPEVIATLPLIIQAAVSLLAFWGFILVFRIRELSSTRVELMKNLWEIGFRRDELKMKIADAKEDKEKKDFLIKLHEELGKDATKRKETIESFYRWEAMVMYISLLPAVFLVASISSGVYGISMTFHTELVDPFTYFTPVVSLFVGAASIICALYSAEFQIVESLEVR